MLADIFSVLLDPLLKPPEFRNLLSFVTPEKQARLLQMKNTLSAQQSLIADIIIRLRLVQLTGLPNNQLLFRLGPFQKPYIHNYPDINYNCSHSGNWIVCATDRYPIGVDVEEIKSIDYQVAKFFFSKEELNYLCTLSDIYRLNYFYKIWTFKEAYAKARGRGLTRSLREINLSTDQQCLSSESQDFGTFYLRELHIHDSVKSAVCTKNLYTEPVVQKVLSDIYNNCLDILVPYVNDVLW